MARNKNKPLADPRGTSNRNRELNQMQQDYQIAEGYVLEEEQASEITRNSLKRSRKFLIASAVFLALCVGAIVGYMFMYNQGIKNRQSSCWLYQQKVEELAQRYVSVNGFSSLPAYIEDVPGFSDLAWQCPDGGVYTWNPITGEYVCSEHNHWPSGFNQVTSTNRGTNTTILNEE